ncbi:MAG: ribbon-helix-helix protein, CopG family [Caldilineaceae bacterium]|nr:ribbon-helix-helix protein, CopG family [Caldilineaceae bacterium]
MIKTIQMTIDDTLLSQVDQVVAQLETSRSAFIRQALVQALQQWRIRELEKQHAAGYARIPVQPGEFDIWLDEQAWGDE